MNKRHSQRLKNAFVDPHNYGIMTDKKHSDEITNDQDENDQNADHDSRDSLVDNQSESENNN